MSLIELGNQIALDRKEQSMSQEQLSEGICSQSALSLIERGLSSPSLEIIFQISLKLKRPLRFYLQYLIEDNVNQTTARVKVIDKLLAEQQYSKILDITQKEISNVNKRTWYEQYLHWAKVIAQYRTNEIDVKKALGGIKKLLDNKYFLLNQNRYLYYRIINSIALIYGEQKNLNMALLYYNKALKNENLLYEEDPNSNLGLCIQRIYYNKTKTLYDLSKYDESIMTANKGIHSSKKLESMSLLGNFYYYLGKSYESLGYSEKDITDAYKKAAFVFEFFEKRDYLVILYSKKGKYLNKSNNLILS